MVKRMPTSYLLYVVSIPQNVERTQSLISTIHTFMSTREYFNIDRHPQEICPAKSVLLAKIWCVSMAFVFSSPNLPQTLWFLPKWHPFLQAATSSLLNGRMEAASSVLDLVNMGLLISSRGSAYLNFSSLVSGSIRIWHFHSWESKGATDTPNA